MGIERGERNRTNGLGEQSQMESEKQGEWVASRVGEEQSELGGPRVVPGTRGGPPVCCRLRERATLGA